jgi:hypothetical protein
MATDNRRRVKLNGNSTCSEPDRNPADPEVARRECMRWYYQINPPSSVPIGDGGAFDWPGPEYETVTPEPDPRHYKKRNGKTHR